MGEFGCVDSPKGHVLLETVEAVRERVREVALGGIRGVGAPTLEAVALGFQPCESRHSIDI